jgi:hypothetical protein
VLITGHLLRAPARVRSNGALERRAEGESNCTYARRPGRQPGDDPRGPRPLPFPVSLSR